jgi:hypothetical protein
MIRGGWSAAIALPFALAPAFGVYAWQTGKIRRRRAILREPFPPEWEAVLQRDVAFFRVLGPAEQRRFRRQLQVFLGEKQITGIGVKADTTCEENDSPMSQPQLTPSLIKAFSTAITYSASDHSGRRG